MPQSRNQTPIWCVLLGCLLVAGLTSYHLFELGSTNAHAEDFLPHWTLARLAYLRNGPKSYDFARQAALLKAEIPPHKTGLLESAHIRDIGISPYPPPMVALYAPLGAFSYDRASQIIFIVMLALVFVTAASIAGATDGRIGFLTASIAILLYPGHMYNLLLGQNALITLALFALGWCGLVRRWDAVAGFAWGLLIYKPHWFVAVLWLPILLRRWRVIGFMVLSAAWLAALGTVLVGPEGWFRWLAQVRTLDTVTFTSPWFREWILGMACDVRGTINQYLPGNGFARPLGWLALAVVGTISIVTTRRALRQPAEPLDREMAGPAWLATSCMIIPYSYYYDQCVVLLPLLVAWSLRSRLRYWQLGLLAIVTVGYYVALPVMMNRDSGPFTLLYPTNEIPAWMQPRPAGWNGGPPWATIAAGALWLLTLTFRDASTQRAEFEEVR